MRAPAWTWSWAWRTLLGWSGLDLDADRLTKLERWQIVAHVVPLGLRRYYLRPCERWLLARMPRWTAVLRLQPLGHGWHRIPDHRALEHCVLRFGVHGFEEGDLIRIEKGRVSAMAYEDRHFCEIIRYRADGEIEDDNMPSKVGAAWSGYASQGFDRAGQ